MTTAAPPNNASPMTMFGLVNICNQLIETQSVVNGNASKAAVNLSDFLKVTFDKLQSQADTMATFIDVMQYVQIIGIGLTGAGIVAGGIFAATPVIALSSVETAASVIDAAVAGVNAANSTIQGTVQIGQGVVQGSIDIEQGKISSYGDTQKSMTSTVQNTSSTQEGLGSEIAQAINSYGQSIVAKAHI